MLERLKRLITILSDWIKNPNIGDSKSIRVGKAVDGRIVIGLPFAICEPVPDLKDKNVRYLACNLTPDDAAWLSKALAKELQS